MVLRAKAVLNGESLSSSRADLSALPPTDAALKQWGVESYCGRFPCLIPGTGTVVGHLAILSRAANAGWASRNSRFMRIFAGRGKAARRPKLESVCGTEDAAALCERGQFGNGAKSDFSRLIRRGSDSLRA